MLLAASQDALLAPDPPKYSLSSKQGHVEMMDYPLTNQGLYTFTFINGKNAAHHISVNHTLDQSCEGLQRASRGAETGFKTKNEGSKRRFMTWREISARPSYSAIQLMFKNALDDMAGSFRLFLALATS